MNYTQYHIIINAQGTHGDLHPMIGLAKALRDRGYQVSLLANDAFSKFIVSHKLDFISLGTAEQHYRYYRDSRVWDPKQNQLEIYFDEMTRHTIKIGYDYVIAASHSNRKVIVITFDVIANGSGMAAEFLHLPRICISLAPSAISSAQWYSPVNWIPAKLIPFWLRSLMYQQKRKRNNKHALKEKVYSDLNAIRNAYGLGECSFADPESQILHIGFFPEWFGMRQPDWPANVRLVGFPMFDEVRPARHLEVSRFIADHGRPLVYTTGSGVADATEIFREGRKICEILNVPGIFVGSAASKALLEGSEKFLHIDYIDFENLLPQCLALIHHGGIGTTAQAIKAGIPQVIRPITFDQPDNAHRVFLLGLGISIFPKKFKANRVSAVLAAILRAVPTSRQFQKYALELKRGDAIERACDIIDATLHKRVN